MTALGENTDRRALDALDDLATRTVARWEAIVRVEQRHRLTGAVLRAALVGAVTVAALPLPQRGGYSGDASTTSVALAVLASAALIVRPWRPFTALAGTVLCGIAFIAHTGQFNTAMDLPVAVATCTVAATSRPAAGVVAAAAAWLSLLIASFVFGDSWVFVEHLGLVAWVIVGGLLGGVFQYHRRHVDDVYVRGLVTAALLRADAENLVIQERLRIARELHDVVAHHVATVSLQVGVANRQLPDRPEEAKAMLTGIEENARSAMAELKQVVGMLRLSADDGTHLTRASITRLDRLITVFREGGVEVTLTQTGAPRVLPVEADVAAYRAAQEALTNATKHAPGASVDVELSYVDDLVHLRIANDLTAAATTVRMTAEVGGYGLAGMRERVELAGGECEALIDDGRFVVSLVFPARSEPTDSMEEPQLWQRE